MLSNSLHGQHTNFESKLPIFKFETGGLQIVDEPKTTAVLQIINNDDGPNHYSDTPTDYDGWVGIEIRGASSSRYPQKPYLFETRDSLGENNNVSLLGLPEENDWVLLSHYNDKSFLRNLLGFYLFEKMGHYAPRGRLCEVFINDEYQGIYLFSEKLKRDKNRIDIARLNPEEVEGEDLTGGYIFKVDYIDGDEHWISKYSPIDHPNFKVKFVYYYPKSEDIKWEQKDYLRNYVTEFEDALYNKDLSDPKGYKSFIHDSSFVDYFLISELSRNNDGFKKSRYFYKDKNGPIKAGPVWDFDWAWKNISECDVVSATNGSGWAYQINDCNPWVKSPGWTIKMLKDRSYANQINCRYLELRESIFSEDYIFHYIDSVAALVEEAQVRHFNKYEILGKRTGAPEVEPPANTYDEEVARLKTWISLRLSWLDRNMVGNCGETPDEYTDELLVVYPNPTRGNVKINSYKIFQKINIYDLSGRLCFNKST
ncbi:MAG: CotH kinase family protein, partial [Draconibacterium sp.]|nr:CotH kinase family protein [Draconibacterium sp.]